MTITITLATAARALSALENRRDNCEIELNKRGNSEDGVTKILKEALVNENAAIAELKYVLESVKG